MSPVQTVQVESVVFHPERRPDGEDGYVLYLVLIPKEGYVNSCRTHPGLVHRYEMQPFTRGEWAHRKGASKADVDGNRANLWGWNGDAHAPSLSPSFLAERSSDRHAPFVLHAFFRAGRLELCPDSTVRLELAPRTCHVVDETGDAAEAM